MAKPRVIIADTDEGYIAPLQLKFAKDFFDLINVEIITDVEYFEELFSNPQKSEILIVSEKLYNTSLQKHNIACTFVMMEHYDEEETGDLNVIKLFKYTSIKEIFSEIESKCADIFKIDSVNKQDPQVIVVTSASGGVGKTTVAMGISACLVKNHKRVLYINASELQTFQCYLENATPIVQSDIYAKIHTQPNSVYSEIKHSIRREVFNYVPPFKAALISLGISKDVYINLIEQAKESDDYDFIIVDTDTVFDDFKAKLIGISDKTIFVMKQDKASVISANIMMSNINTNNSEKYVFVCNNYDKDRMNALVSTDLECKFTVSEYIEDLAYKLKNTMSIDVLLNNEGIYKVALFMV